MSIYGADGKPYFVPQSGNDPPQEMQLVGTNAPIVFGTRGQTAYNWWEAVRFANLLAFKQAVALLPGTYTASGTPVPLVSGVTIIGNEGVNIVGAMTSTGGQTNSIFYAAGIAGVGSTTLSSDVTLGSLTCVVANQAQVPDGSSIVISHSNAGLYYTVVSHAGSTLTLDRPILLPFKSGDVVAVQTPPNSIRIYGNGMNVSGTGDRIVELSGAFDCYVCDINGSGVWTNNIMFSYDIGSRDSVFERIRANCNFNAAYGITLESCEHCSIVQCYASNATFSNIALLDCANSNVERSAGWGQSIGCAVGRSGVGTGCYDCKVISGEYYANQLDGVYVGGASQNTKIIGVSCVYNGRHGIFITDDGSGGSTGTQVWSVTCNNNTGFGIKADLNHKNTQVQNLMCNNNAGGGAYFFCEAQVNNFTSVDCLNYGLRTDATGTGDVRVTNFRVETITAGSWIGFELAMPGRTTVRSGIMPMAHVASQQAIEVQTGVELVLGDVRTTTSGGGGLVMRSGSWLRYEKHCDFTSTSGPFTFDAGSQNSFGTLTLNGATPVDYTFSKITANDPIRLTRKTAGGTMAHYTYTITAATKLTVTGTAGDTSILAVEIG